jgi:hypothetical protein
MFFDMILQRAIGRGARRVVVPGNFPIGCFPVYLSQFQPNDAAAYDEFHCLKGLNSLASYHNELLKQTVEGLKTNYPDVIIVYGDYYKAFMSIYQNAQSLGEFIFKILVNGRETIRGPARN